MLSYVIFRIALIKVSPKFEYNDHVNEAVFANEEVIVAGNLINLASVNLCRIADSM